MSAGTGLKLSLLLNALLCAWVIAGLRHRETPAPTNPAPKTPAMTAATVDVPAVKSIAPPPHPFRWQQLESSDYRLYVQNLRRIGCPEATLRAIVTADMDAVYRNRIDGLEQQLSELEKPPGPEPLDSFAMRQSLKTKLQELPKAEAAEIADLLGVTMDTSPSATSTAAVPGRARRDPLNAPVRLPLVFQTDPAALGLDARQEQLVDELRASFWEKIGGPDQDPSDPAYRARWQHAQPEADEMLRGMLGVSVFENYQLAAHDDGADEAAKQR